MNIHTLNDLSGNNNNNNAGNNRAWNNNANDQNQNNQLFLGGLGPAPDGSGGQQSFFDQLFPKSVFHTKTLSFLIICILTGVYIVQLILYHSIYKPRGYSWGCLLYQLGASEISSVANHYQYHRLITPMLTHNSFGHLLSNVISIIFIGFNVEFDLQNKTNYLLLYLISGVIGNFCSLLFSYQNLSMGASGAILGLCGYFVLYFILNWDKMNYNQKCCSMIFFFIIFLNLISGVSEGGSQVDVHSHIGGFLAGLAFTMFLSYRNQALYRFSQQYMKILYYLSIGFLIGLPLISVIAINLKDYSDNCEFICLAQNM